MHLPAFPVVGNFTVAFSCCAEDFDSKQHPARFQTNWLSLLPQLQELVIEEHCGVGTYVSLSGLANLRKLAVVELIRCELDNTTATTTNTTLHDICFQLFEKLSQSAVLVEYTFLSSTFRTSKL